MATPDLHVLTPGEAVDYHLCKVDGCTGAIVDHRGVYALLCQRHRDEKRAARRDVAAQQAELPAAETYTDRAMRVLAAGRALDAAKKRYAPARENMQAALAEWRAALQAAAGGGNG